jgi:1-acyl-sn-glycerol-3-phosphate acyltransferase
MRWIITHIFRWLGWKIVGDLPPDIQKAVLVIAPHTSNWDFFYGMSTIYIKRVSAKFAIKKEIMFFPLGPILKWMGAISIDRSQQANSGKKLNQVSMITDLFQKRKKLLIIIAPEGTRKYAARWKSGFYHIATKAEIPIVLGYLDYAKKEAGIGPVIYPTGDIERDMAEIQSFYKDKTAKYPHQGVR